jgi:hypothetical protein
MAKQKKVTVAENWIRVSEGQCFITNIFEKIRIYIGDDTPIGDDAAFTLKSSDTFTNNLTEAVWVKAVRSKTSIIVKAY